MRIGKIELREIPERRERCHIRGILFIQDRRHIDHVLAQKHRYDEAGGKVAA